MAKLLIVDDEVDIREFARNFFKKRGIDVLTANGGLEAIKIIESEMPDLVLLDIHMEDLNGLDVLKILREKGNMVKVIMVTGIEEEGIVKEAHDLAIQNFIHKPLILDELERIVLKELSP